ncbi:hypothetical protein [Litchfieldia salsa]|uniref:Uncharacterized protein n=1 Tax=Litchfieldia salsa TaxID=930152 RepID=A0A1H0W546_9BACI|nr:hypothetical protein [Litchfieldia salsa]SDP85601.1 hypothetical protein SAMN05216565_10950 [Litchfieldia salsa]
MKGCLVTFGGILLLFIGVIFYDYIYYDLTSFRATDAAEKYLESKYDEEFELKEAEYSKILGERDGSYQIEANPIANPHIPIQIHVTESSEILSDNYAESKWRFELNEQLNSYIGQFTDSFLLMANVSIPEDVRKKYSVTKQYEEIAQQHSGKLNHILFLHVLRDPTGKVEAELEWLYKVVTYLQNQSLGRFSIKVHFYSETFLEGLSEEAQTLSYTEFEDQYKFEGRSYIFTYSSESAKSNVEKLEGPENLKEFMSEVK